MRSNRWLRVMPFFLIQGVTGSVYAWSMFNAPLCSQLGTIAPASGDWGLGEVLPIFSVSAAVLGLVTASLGTRIETMGPRASGAISAGAWTAGLSVSAYACQIHSLPLLFAGYGILGGVGWGFGYIAPISGLLRWFPEKKGLLQGLGMTSFGLGSLAAPVAATHLIDKNFKIPVRLEDGVELFTREGARFASVAGEMKEVVVAAGSDPARGIVEGAVYLVGTGDPGVTATFLTLGSCYGGLLAVAAMACKLPPIGFSPASTAATASLPSDSAKIDDSSDALKKEIDSQTKADLTPESVQVTASEATKTPQFWLLLGVMAGNATAGLGIISSGKLLMSDCFSVTMPEVATPAVCALFVSALAGANTAGRLKWGLIGDRIGRRNTLLAFAVTSPACAMIPIVIAAAAGSPELGSSPLIAFVVLMIWIIACYGGLFAVMPAYVADLYGSSNAGAIMGRLLCGYSAAAIAGPGMLATLRSKGDWAAVEDLASKVDPSKFEATFGASPERLHELWEKKTVTIQNLLALVPPELGITDPTHTLYSNTFYLMSGILGVAAMCSFATRPLSRAMLESIAKSRKGRGA